MQTEYLSIFQKFVKKCGLSYHQQCFETVLRAFFVSCRTIPHPLFPNQCKYLCTLKMLPAKTPNAKWASLGEEVVRKQRVTQSGARKSGNYFLAVRTELRAGTKRR